jgi:hypothetical protein
VTDGTITACGGAILLRIVTVTFRLEDVKKIDFTICSELGV